MGAKGSKGDEVNKQGRGNNRLTFVQSKVVDNANPFISNQRKCTDILCLLLFLVFWLGMIIIAAVAYVSGQPEKLVYGVDFRGRTCGAKASKSVDVPAYDLREYKYLLYPRLPQDLYDISLNGDVTDPSNLNKFFGVCVQSCPEPMDLQGKQLYAHAYLDYTTHPDPINTISTSSGTSVEEEQAGSPWMVALKTTNVLYRCLDLEHLNTTALARCVDPCEDGETSLCGTDESTNPYQLCGKDGCEAYISKTWDNKCRTAETREIVDKKGAAKSNPIYDSLNSKWQLVSRWVGDIEKAALPILLCGGLFALALGFVWLFMLKFCAGFFVWLSIFLVVMMLLIGTFYLAYKGELISAADVTSVLDQAGVTDKAMDINTYINQAGFSSAQDKVQMWAISAYVFIAVDVIVLLLLIFLCSRIKIAVGIIREASKAVQAMPFLIAFPLIPTACVIVLVIYWVITAAYIASSGKITTETITDAYGQGNETYGLNEYSDNNLMNYMLFYHLFGFLWTNQFFQAIGYTTIAGAVAEYYWTLDKTDIRRLPIGRSFYRTMRYHLGSLAFGSLIIAVVQMVRLVLEYIDRKTKNAQEGNRVVKVAMMCCKCFLWCFEKCLKFLNANAFIMVAMKGASFCSAMKDAFTLLMANAARVATVGIISTFLLLLGKLFIVAFSVSCMFFMIQSPPSNLPSFFLGDLENITSPIFPMGITAAMSYAVASFFLGVYETAIDTILLCFCEDCKVNKSTGTYYMSDELLTFVDGAAKKNAFRHFKDAKSPRSNDV